MSKKGLCPETFHEETPCHTARESPLKTKAMFSLHKKFVSPLLKTVFVGGGCRFTPTCSEYAHDAVKKYGLAKGGVMAIRRILRCHPWSGVNPIDPVQ